MSSNEEEAKKRLIAEKRKKEEEEKRSTSPARGRRREREGGLEISQEEVTQAVKDLKPSKKPTPEISRMSDEYTPVAIECLFINNRMYHFVKSKTNINNDNIEELDNYMAQFVKHFPKDLGTKILKQYQEKSVSEKISFAHDFVELLESTIKNNNKALYDNIIISRNYQDVLYGYLRPARVFDLSKTPIWNPDRGQYETLTYEQVFARTIEKIKDVNAFDLLGKKDVFDTIHSLLEAKILDESSSWGGPDKLSTIVLGDTGETLLESLKSLRYSIDRANGDPLTMSDKERELAMDLYFDLEDLERKTLPKFKSNLNRDSAKTKLIKEEIAAIRQSQFMRHTVNFVNQKEREKELAINHLKNNGLYYTIDKETEAKNKVKNNQSIFTVIQDGKYYTGHKIFYKANPTLDDVSVVQFGIANGKYEFTINKKDYTVDNVRDILDIISKLHSENLKHKADTIVPENQKKEKNSAVVFNPKKTEPKLFEKITEFENEFEKRRNTGNDMPKSEHQLSEEKKPVSFKVYDDKRYRDDSKLERKSTYHGSHMQVSEYENLLKNIEKHYIEKREKTQKDIEISIVPDENNINTLGVVIEEGGKSELINHFLTENHDLQITLEPSPPSDEAIINVMQEAVKFNLDLELDKTPDLSTSLRIYEASLLYGKSKITLPVEEHERLRKDKTEIGETYRKIKEVSAKELKEIVDKEPDRKLGESFNLHEKWRLK